MDLNLINSQRLYVDKSLNKNKIFNLLGIEGTYVVDQKFRKWSMDNDIFNACLLVLETDVSVD